MLSLIALYTSYSVSFVVCKKTKLLGWERHPKMFCNKNSKSEFF